MLAQLKAGNHGPAVVVPLVSAAEELPLRTASLDLVTAFNRVHHFDLGQFLTAVARVLQPGGQLFIYTRTPQQNGRTIWGRYFPGFTEHEQRLHSQPVPGRRRAYRRAHGGRNADLQAPALEHRRAAQGPGRGPPLLDVLALHPGWNCARPSRRSWPVYPAPRSPGLTSTSWSSSAGAAATRRSLTVRQPGEPAVLAWRSQPAAADGQGRAGDVGRVWRGQERDCGGDPPPPVGARRQHRPSLRPGRRHPGLARVDKTSQFCVSGGDRLDWPGNEGDVPAVRRTGRPS